VQQAFAQADAVFEGRCISGKQLATEHDTESGDLDRCEFTFEVTRTWKGTAEKKQITVQTGSGRGDCGYRFAIGGSYILYCYDEKGVLHTDICARTCDIDSGWRTEAERKQLDDAKAKSK
jgi:hypothetical protein